VAKRAGTGVGATNHIDCYTTQNEYTEYRCEREPEQEGYAGQPDRRGHEPAIFLEVVLGDHG